MEALRQLKAAEAPLFLSPSQELSQKARLASQHLFAALRPYSLGCDLPELVTHGFDAEQIWAQIEAQNQELIATAKAQLRKLEKNPKDLERQLTFGGERVVREKRAKEEVEGSEMMEESDEEEEEEDEEEEEGSEEEEGEEQEGDGLRDVEDEFFKIRDLERFVEGEEEKEYGNMGKEKKRKRRAVEDSEDEDSEDDDKEEDDDDDEDEDELGLMGMDGLEDDDDDAMGLAKYDDFFGKKKITQKKAWEPLERSYDSDLDERPNKKKTSKPLEGSDESDLDDRPKKVSIVEKKNLSTYEKEQEKLRSQIEEMEKSNLQPKEWMMQGEVTASTRGKNSALEVDLDFEHNVRPAPVITEEVTATLEELIQKRILEGRFNDVRKPPTLLNKAPKEMKEMDENKSKKDLATVYEGEYTGLVSAALSFSDEQKKEASTLFKKLCLKLDALSHFHFTPKPVIEDMSIQANVPALAMEEIAPMAVSDAAMLAPEEVFSGKGDIKEQTELTQAERKMRRANKKRKFKAESEKRMAGKAEKSMSKEAEGIEAS